MSPKLPMKDEIIKEDISSLWKEAGNLGGRLSSVETKVGTLEATQLHWQTNHRAEVNGNLDNFRKDSLEHWEKMETRVKNMVKDLKNDFFDPLLLQVKEIQAQIIPSADIRAMGNRLGRIEIFMYTMIGGGTVVGMFFLVIINWSAIRSFFHG